MPILIVSGSYERPLSVHKIIRNAKLVNNRTSQPVRLLPSQQLSQAFTTCVSVFHKTFHTISEYNSQLGISFQIRLEFMIGEAQRPTQKRR